MDNAADEAGTELKNNSKKPNVGQNPERLDKHRDISVVEIKENSSMEVNSSETWSYGNPNKIGPGRRRFVVGYYPNLNTAITRHSIWTNNRRRSHWTVRPHNTAKGIPAKAQDLYWSGHSRITSDSDHMCLDESNTLGDLYWHSCHNGGNQHFWFAQFGADKSKNAFHIHVGGNKGRRRRGQCVDYGGGRLYTHRCHNGDNQRFRYWDATTTTSTTTTTTTTKLTPVMIKTWMLPEKMEWTIYVHNGKKLTKICSGGKYSTWYTEFGTGCRLPPGKYTLYCKDQKGFGWSGGYLKIKHKHLCKDFTWSGKQKKVTFKL